jgi:branched-chain amino acid transport system permease protein
LLVPELVQSAKRRRSLTWIINTAIIALLVLLPFFFEPFQVNQFAQILVIALAVMGLNLLTGFTGQVSVGHSAFFGVGAYTVGLLQEHTALPVGLNLIVGFAAGAAAGAIIGLPSLRIRGTHLAIITLVLAAAFPSLVNLLSEHTGGTQGLRVERLTPDPGFPLAADQARYFAVLVAVLLVAACVLFLDRSRTGRALRALGDHETAAIAFGVRSSRLRVGVFSASAAITALAGGLFAVTTGFISSGTSLVTILGSIELLTALVVGGRAILAGPLIGAVIVELLPNQVSRTSPELAHLVYGAILIIIILVAPSGISGFHVTRWFRRPKRNLPDPEPSA